MAFADGLAETVAWYRDNRAWWEPIKAGEYRDYYEKQYAARLAGLLAVLPTDVVNAADWGLGLGVSCVVYAVL